MTETTFSFDCEGETLVGVLHHAAGAGPGVGFVIVVGGPQYRAGSHRHFTTFARSIAQAGYPVLRFDVAGMGDSSGALRSFEHIAPDIGAAIDALCARVPGLQRVVLWGLCDGASASLLYLQQRRDPRVAALCLLNPWVRSETSQARTQVKHYYLARLRQREFWLKLASGKVAWSAVAGLMRNVRTALGGTPTSPPLAADAPYQDRMLAGWTGFGGPTLVLLSGNDYTAKEFLEYAKARPAWQHAMLGRAVEQHACAAADHTFSDADAKRWVLESTLAWMARAKVGHERMEH